MQSGYINVKNLHSLTKTTVSLYVRKKELLLEAPLIDV
jgi:hypothetical protein